MTDGEQETAEVRGPLYHVEMPVNMPNLVFPIDEYEIAFQNATGERTADAGDSHPDEDRITIIDFDGVAEVPIADV